MIDLEVFMENIIKEKIDRIIANYRNNHKYNKNSLILYHGSKGGISGDIKPVSRIRCDFGSGFYMGDTFLQPLTLICNNDDAIFYILNVDLSGLKVLKVDIDLDWALLVAYHRGKMEGYEDSELFKKYQNMTSGYDMVIGYIANDRMFYVLEQFFEGQITDQALIQSLSALNLGRQYVALTEKACSQIKVIDKMKLSKQERQHMIEKSSQQRKEGINLANDICKKNRRTGLFFDEILSEEANENEIRKL